MTATDQKEKLKLILTEEEAESVLSQGKELSVFYLLSLSKRIQELEGKSAQTSSSTPSGMKC